MQFCYNIVTPLVSNPTVSVKRTMEGTYDGWETLSFVEDSYWQSLNLATTRTEEFNHLTRYVFALPDLDKYSHVYIRMYYRYGISMFLNGVNIFNDHVAIVPELPPFFIPAEEGSGFSANTYVKYVNENENENCSWVALWFLPVCLPPLVTCLLFAITMRSMLPSRRIGVIPLLLCMLPSLKPVCEENDDGQ